MLKLYSLITLVEAMSVVIAFPISSPGFYNGRQLIMQPSTSRVAFRNVYMQFLQLTLLLDGMHACVCMCLHVTKSAQGPGKLIFGVGVVQKCQNGIHLKNEIKVQRSQNFSWQYLKYLGHKWL